jgi:hypothetical protein
MLPLAEYKMYEGAPHGLFYTHREQLNADLVRFCTTGVSASKPTNTTMSSGKI